MDFSALVVMQQRHETKSPHVIFQEALEQTVLADQLGFSTVWYPEHHFSNYSMCPSPLVLASHAAALTKKIRLATGILVAPLYNPLRLAAEIALVNSLSQGRLDLGFGSGYQAFELERFGVTLEEAVPRMMEVLDVVQLALKNKSFSYDGKFFQIKDTAISVRPFQQPMPPIWIAGSHKDFVARAIREDHNLIFSGMFANWKRIGGVRQMIDEAAIQQGKRPEQAKVSLLRMCFASDNKKDVEQYVDCGRYQQRVAVSLKKRKEIVRGSYFLDELPYDDELPFEKMLQNIPVGDEETVIERLALDLRVAKAQHLCIVSQLGDMDQKKTLHFLERFATRIMPAVNKELAKNISPPSIPERKAPATTLGQLSNTA